MELYTEQKVCRYCSGKKLEAIISLGDLYPSDFVGDAEEEKGKAPLTLVQCKECGLVQLKHTVDLDSMYREYWYQSGLNNSMVESLRDVADYVKTFLEKGDVLVDIGCNDWTMLSMFDGYDYSLIGYDPARNLKRNTGNGLFINEYFSEENYPLRQKAKVITAIAMFYDLPDVKKFVQDVDKILADDGVFIVQYTDLVSMLRINAVDNICHEHLEYYSLEVMDKIMWETANLIPIEVSYNEVNGGSIRATYAWAGQVQDQTISVLDARNAERDFLLRYPLRFFGDISEKIRKAVRNHLADQAELGNITAVLGASTKGNTLLQYYGLSYPTINHAAEINPDKFGKLTVGTHIPIIPQEESLERNPDAYLILPWHFIDNFIEKFDSYLERGGELIVPLPEPRVYYKKKGKVEFYDIKY